METTDISLEAIRVAVRKWVDEIEKMYPSELSIERMKDEPGLYWAFIWLKNCGAQVIVDDPLWAPYRHVCFEAVSIIDKTAQPVFSWYDCDEDNIDSIIQNLQAGIEYAVNYQSENL